MVSWDNNSYQENKNMWKTNLVEVLKGFQHADKENLTQFLQSP